MIDKTKTRLFSYNMFGTFRRFIYVSEHDVGNLFYKEDS